MKIKTKDNINWLQDEITHVFVLYIQQRLSFPTATASRVLRQRKLLDYARKIIEQLRVIWSSPSIWPVKNRVSTSEEIRRNILF